VAAFRITDFGNNAAARRVAVARLLQLVWNGSQYRTTRPLGQAPVPAVWHAEAEGAGM
jgi:hypothetical protein